jgi:predicted Zn-dependent protease
MARALLAALGAAAPEAWVDADRASLEARLKAAVGPVGTASASAAGASASGPMAPAPANEPAPPALPDDVAALPADARGRFTDAARALAAGDAATADAKARPLYAAHPKVVSVQDLRCKIAVAKGGDWEPTKKECDPLMQLSLGKR